MNFILPLKIKKTIKILSVLILIITVIAFWTIIALSFWPDENGNYDGIFSDPNCEDNQPCSC